MARLGRRQPINHWNGQDAKKRIILSGGGTTISCTPGNAVADGITAGINRIIPASPGNTAAAGVTASVASSQLTLGQFKSGNSWYLDASGSTVSALYVIVPREDGSTLDSTDSSIWVQAIQETVSPFGMDVTAIVI